MSTQPSERGQFSFERFATSPEYVSYNIGFVNRTLDVKPRAVILDMACGTGLIALLVRNRFNGVPATIIGIDPNPASVAIAREHVPSIGQTYVRFLQTTGDKAVHEMESDVIDIAYFANAIHEIPERDAKLVVLRGIYDLLKPDGKLHITSTYTGEWGKELEDSVKWGIWKLKAFQEFGKKRDKSTQGMEILSTEEYCDLLKEAGFIVDQKLISTVPVALTSDSLKAISQYDAFIRGLFVDMADTNQFSLSEKNAALIKALNTIQEAYRKEQESKGNPNTPLVLRRNWVEITVQKPPAFPH